MNRAAENAIAAMYRLSAIGARKAFDRISRIALIRPPWCDVITAKPLRTIELWFLAWCRDGRWRRRYSGVLVRWPIGTGEICCLALGFLLGAASDRNGVGMGKGVSVRVDLGVGR